MFEQMPPPHFCLKIVCKKGLVFQELTVMACQLELELTEDDVPGSKLEEPLKSAMVPALRRWLLCHGIQVPTSLKKLIERLGGNICLLLMLLNRQILVNCRKRHFR